MTDLPGDMEWASALIPEMAARTAQFTVDTEEVDDELVEIFFDEINRLTAELKAGLEAQDAEAIRVSAHSIKGMGGTMGLPEVSVVALEIETRAKEDRLPETGELIDGLAGWLRDIGRDS